MPAIKTAAFTTNRRRRRQQPERPQEGNQATATQPQRKPKRLHSQHRLTASPLQANKHSKQK
jgi:hypothetical protein